MPRVTLKFGNSELGTWEIYDQQPVVVGRSPDSTIVIDNPAVSRYHCQIEKRGEFCIITDLGSNNGTFHNGKKVQSASLNSGDEIAVGKHLLLFVDEQMSADPAAPAPGEEQADVDFGPNTMMMDMSKQVSHGKEKRGHITIKTKKSEKTIMLQKPDYIIGSSPSCDIIVKGWRVSKKHAVIVKDSNGFRIIDVSDKKPTLVNDSPIDKAVLKKGDIIKIGSNAFSFYQEE